MKKTTRKLINDAADLLEKDGWTFGVYEDGRRRCPVGAVVRAAGLDPYGGGNWYADPDVNEAIRVIGSAVREPSWDVRTQGAVTKWNDTEGRTAPEVIGKLRAIAAAK